MAVLKNKTQGNFVIISQNIMRDNNLNLTERGLLVTLLSLPDGWNLSIAGLSKILPDGKERIGNALNKLISYGYLTREQGRGERGKFGKNVLEVHETPICGETPTNEESSPYPGNPYTDNPCTDKPSPGNQSQVNNNNTSNKRVSKKECVDTLTESDYESLINDFGKELVDYQIKRIEENHYKGCMNRGTLSKWCSEYKARSPVKVKCHKTGFSDFHEREYDYAELMKSFI